MKKIMLIISLLTNCNRSNSLNIIMRGHELVEDKNEESRGSIIENNMLERIISPTGKGKIARKVRNSENSEALIKACEKNDIELAKCLIEKGADIDHANYSGDLPLVTAILNDNIELAEYLIKEGADVNCMNMSYSHDIPLIIACEKGNIELIKLLIEKGADIDRIDYYHLQENLACTPLIIACEKNNTELIKLLVEKGVDIDCTDGYGYTPLMVACEKNNTELIEFLIEKGADIDYRNYSGNASLIIACEKDKTELIKLLVEKGAEINSLNDYGDTPLILSILNDKTELAIWLIEKGAKINYRNYSGDTPLTTALKKNNQKLVKILIENGSNIYNNPSIFKIIGEKLAEQNSKSIDKIALESLNKNINDNSGWIELAYFVINLMKNDHIKLYTSVNKNTNIDTDIKEKTKDYINLIIKIQKLPKDIFNEIVIRVR